MGDYAPGFVPDAAPKKPVYADGFVPDAPVPGGITERAGKAVADFLVPRDPSQPTITQRAADAIVPRDPSQPTAPGAMVENLKTPTGAGGALGTLLPTILSAVPQTRALGMAANTPLGRVLGGGLGAAGGALIEGKDPLEEGASAAGWNAVGEGVMGGGSKIVRSLPTVKGRIAEGQARGLTDAIRVVSPELADVVGQNRNAVAPTMKGPKTSAALQETALGKSGQDALSAAFERGMTQVDQLAPGATLDGPALQRAYAMVPDVVQQEFIGAVGQGGFTPRQAAEIISYLGKKAFTDAQGAAGVTADALKSFRGKVLDETVAGLRAVSPDAADVFTSIRPPYAGGTQYLEMLSAGKTGPFRSYGNRVNLDENGVRDFISANRAELQEKLGPEGWAALTKAYGGAQPGTRSLMAPGGGGATDALNQVYGRAQGGAPQIGGSLLRTILPNIGYSPAGRAAYTLPPSLQAILDVGLQKAGGAALSGERK